MAAAAQIDIGHGVMFDQNRDLATNLAGPLREGGIVALRADGIYETVLGLPSDRDLSERVVLYIDYSWMRNLDVGAFTDQIHATCRGAIEIEGEDRIRITTEAVAKKIIFPLGSAPRWNPCRNCVLL